MKRVFFLVFLLISLDVSAQVLPVTEEAIPAEYFITRSREEYMKKLLDMPYGIRQDDPVDVIVQKMETFLKNYQPQERYTDDLYAKESNLQAVKSVKQGGFGIGAILIDPQGKIIARNHNQQMQKKRSDLHGEMALLTDFERSPAARKYMIMYVYKPGMTVFSSAEPCPMCFIRLATAGVSTKYCTPGPDDGMVTRIGCLPPYWSDLARRNSFEKANSSPVMQKTAHLLFFSYYLDNRGPGVD